MRKSTRGRECARTAARRDGKPGFVEQSAGGSRLPLGNL